MSIAIHAEADVTGQRLVLLAGGPVHLVAGAAKTIETLTPLFGKSDPPGALVTPLTWPAVVQLQAAFAQAWLPGPALCAWITEQITARTATADDTSTLTYAPPAGLTPYPHQVAGAAMIAATGRALITDEPRTGKTITTILGLVERARREHGSTGSAAASAGSGPVLVVCPASVVDAWVEAWSTWAPHVHAIAWRGSPTKRTALIGTADVYVTSYDLARIDTPSSSAAEHRKKSLLPRLEATALVIDECHLIKNPRETTKGGESTRSASVRRLARGVTGRQGSVVALSGTPITHHPGDLWPTLDALEHDAWPSRVRWVQRYCTVLAGDYRDEVLGLAPHAEPEFRLTLLGQHRRVARADVMSDLPSKVYSVRTVDLPRTWRKVYDDFEREMLAALPDGTELSVMDVMSKFGHLSRLASSAADVRIEFGPDVDEQTGLPKRHVHLDLKAGKGQQWKIDALLEVLDERCDPAQAAGLTNSTGQREQVLCFAPSSQLVKLAGAAAAAKGYAVGYVVGGQKAAERTETIRRFQAGELDLICATPGAGGVGITLSAAGTVVFLQRPWSLVESVQAEDRAEGPHPITGIPERGTEVIDIVARDSIDTRVRAVLRERAGQLADLVGDPRIVAQLLGGAERPTVPTTTEESAA